jgi:glutamyl/glutaminyl-tRNA synthetase
MMNFLATLGWNDGSEQEIFSPSELMDFFSLDRVQRSPARFDEKRLLWLNGQWIRRLSLDELFARSLDFWPSSAESASVETKKRVLGLIQDRLKTLEDIRTSTGYFFAEPTIDPSMLSSHNQLSKLSSKQVIELLATARQALDTPDYSPENLQEALNKLLVSTGQKPGVLFSLVRLVVSWSPFSPGLNDTLAVLGREVVTSRIAKTIQELEK